MLLTCNPFMQDKKLKETFPTIPSLDDLQALEADGLKADIIIVDTERDKKVFMLKQLSAALVKGLNSSPALVIKKIAGLVSFFFPVLIGCNYSVFPCGIPYLGHKFHDYQFIITSLGTFDACRTWN